MQTPDLDELELCYVAHLDCFSQHMGLEGTYGPKDYQDVELSMENGSDFLHQLLPARSQWHVAHRSRHVPFSSHSCGQRSRSSLLQEHVCTDAPRHANSSTTARLICKETAVRNRSIGFKTRPRWRFVTIFYAFFFSRI